MRLTLRHTTGSLALSLAACTSLVGCPGPMPSPDAEAPGDATPRDVNRPDATPPADVPVPMDTQPPTDTPTPTDTPPPPMDTPVPSDTPVPMDVIRPMDVITPIDTPVPTDTRPPTDAPPADVSIRPCGVSPEVGAHVTAMATTGWTALNRSRALLMHGCAGAASPRDCLATVPLASAADIGAGRSAIAGANLRVLHTGAYRSAYWTRSSADGRFVAHGNRIVDLAASPPRVISTTASFDPGFFPDNSGFMFGGTGRLCPHSVLTTGMPTLINFMEPGCVGTRIGLYEHLGASLGGSDYWAVDTGWIADDGGHSATTRDPSTTSFGGTARAGLTLVANSGSGFRDVASQFLSIPMQGDAVISPSSQLMVTRRADGAGGQSAYVVYRLETTRLATTFTATLREVANYCVSGGKPAFSFDERWLVYHHYIGGNAGAINDQDARDMGFSGASDPGFAPYRTQGAANVYLVDLATGTRTRVTSMGPGQYALYPHFRSDGWMYFIVRQAGLTREWVVASDAILRM